MSEYFNFLSDVFIIYTQTIINTVTNRTKYNRRVNRIQPPYEL